MEVLLSHQEEMMDAAQHSIKTLVTHSNFEQAFYKKTTISKISFTTHQEVRSIQI